MTTLQKFGGRKFFMAYTMFVVCTVLRICDWVDMDVFKVVTLGLITAYIAGNVTQKFAEKPTPTAVDIPL